MPRSRRSTATVSKRLKKVKPGAKPVRPKKLSAKRRAREARERLRKERERASEEENASATTSENEEEMDEWEALRTCKDTDSFDTIEMMLGHSSPRVKIEALKQICPCRVWGMEDKAIWSAVFALARDSDLGVRKQVLHTLCDGSPPVFEREVIEAVESFNSEPDKHLRRMAHKVLASYRRTGKWNIM
eukprot:g1437.t1